MRNSASLDFSIGSFPVRVHWSFLLVAVLMGFTYLSTPILLLSWVAIVLVSVLVHELGHAVAAEHYGMFPSIMLYSMGGMTIHGRSKSLTYLQEILLSLAGPFAGFALGGVVYLLAHFLTFIPYLGLVILSQLLWVNIGWGIINLVPMLPLDGGNVMRSLWHWLFRPYDERTPLLISIVIGVLLVIAGLILSQTFLAILAFYITLNNFQALRGGPTMVY